DLTYKKHRHWTKSQLTEKPSIYFHRQCYVAFIDDSAGVYARHLIGVENILWESDYPHTDTSWPFSHQAIDALLDGVSASERRLITSSIPVSRRKLRMSLQSSRLKRIRRFILSATFWDV